MAYFNERADRDTWKELKVNCFRTYILLKDSFQGKTINWLRAIYLYTMCQCSNHMVSNLLIMSVSDEGYSSNAWCALK